MTSGPSERAIADEVVARFELDLDGLTVLTEAASGPYLWTPLLTASAGATRVLAVTADSAYASKEEVARSTEDAATSWGVRERVEVGFEKRPDWLAAADIVTNSGFVRPIDATLIGALKPTAVIPLMWETWELRPDELDLDVCRSRGIVVLGTNESRPPCDMRGYSTPLALKLLAELGITPPARVVLLGGQPSLGGEIARGLPDEGVEVNWFSDEAEGAAGYDGLAGHLAANARDYDAIVVAEHRDPRLLLGDGGLVSPDELKGVNPDLRIGVIAGNVDAAAVSSAGLRLFPEQIRPFGYTTYQPSALGPKPVLELYAGGLKVGEAMARARLAGASPAEAARRALENSPAMDFHGELAWT